MRAFTVFAEALEDQGTSCGHQNEGAGLRYKKEPAQKSNITGRAYLKIQLGVSDQVNVQMEKRIIAGRVSTSHKRAEDIHQVRLIGILKLERPYIQCQVSPEKDSAVPVGAQEYIEPRHNKIKF